jgi:hypothetical protein
MIKHISIVPLLVGLAVGAIAILMIKPEKEVVYKYPNPGNDEKNTYKDKNGVCYQYVAKKVDCDKNESKMKDFPLSK